jgi:general secretion pathway protein A
MYEQFFGFSEPPFNLTPDPKFLFLSRQHKEALANLSYGIKGRKGFVVLTGEVGSGKTTICRALFQELDLEKTRLALILNSMLTEVELLQAINEEFAIHSSSTSKKELLQVLNEYLLRENVEGNNVILIIDEAQNLPFPTLELIRMISNLETETEKLIQIVLVGQPELQEILRRPDLEQLRQRITVRYHITPLNLEETKTYVQRRIEVAGPQVEVEISNAAYERLYQLTRGVPRKINVICDRAFLAAYVENTYGITEHHVNRAAEELGEDMPEDSIIDAEVNADEDGKSSDRSSLTAEQARIYAGLVLITIVIVMASITASIYFVNRQQKMMLEDFSASSDGQRMNPATDNSGAGASTAGASAKSLLNNPDSVIDRDEPTGPLSERPTPKPTPKVETAEAGEGSGITKSKPKRPPAYQYNWEYDSNGVLRVIDSSFAESAAFFNMLAIWGIVFPIEQFEQFSPEKLKNMPFERSKLELRRVSWQAGWRDAIALNIPFIVRWSDPKSELSNYVLVRSVEGRMVVVLDGLRGQKSIQRDRIENNILEVIFYYFDEEGIMGLAPGFKGGVVTALQKRLSAIGTYDVSPPTGEFDRVTQSAVKAVQKQCGLEQTGDVNPLTACAIQTLSRPDRPVLWEQGGYEE